MSRESASCKRRGRSAVGGLVRRSFLALWMALFTVLFSAHGGMAHAAEHIEVQQFTPQLQGDHLVVNAIFGLELTPRLEEALNRGLPLYFVIEFELTRSRWYWFDEKSVSDALRYRLSFNALTRQYRLSTGVLQQSFASLNEALGVMTRVRNWRVAEREAVRAADGYIASLRMRLDVSQLPKPFQINAITDREWQLDTGWRRLTLAPEVP